LRALIPPKRSAAQPVIITIVGRRRGLYDTYLGGTLLLAGTRQPILDGCRSLLAVGFDPGTNVVMKRVGSGVESLRGTIGVAAKLTVDEDRCRFRPARSGDTALPVRQTPLAYAGGHASADGRAA
jgi:hypothetical protein